MRGTYTTVTANAGRVELQQCSRV